MSRGPHRRPGRVAASAAGSYAREGRKSWYAGPGVQTAEALDTVYWAVKATIKPRTTVIVVVCVVMSVERVMAVGLVEGV